MSLLRKLFFRKPPDGLLEIAENVYVFDRCFSMEVLLGDDLKVYMEGIVKQLKDQFPAASFMVFNFGAGDKQSHIARILSEYDMTVIDYPRHYEGCPLLTMEMIHHFLWSTESWLSLGQLNLLLMNSEKGGWPVLVFMLAALLVYQKNYSSEQKTLEMIYKHAPCETLELISPWNPVPSQLRYLQYISRRNVTPEWPPDDRALNLDCVILRMIPNFDGQGGCRPIFHIYGRNPLMPTDQSTKVLFSTPKRSNFVRQFRQVDCELVKIEIHCHVRGDVILECISLDENLVREEMVFRIMFNTSFIRSNILMLNRDQIDILWDAKDRFPKDFRAEVLFSEMNSTTSHASMEFVCGEEKEGLPVEAFAKVHEIFNDLDWLGRKEDANANELQQIALRNSPVNSNPYPQELKSDNITSEFIPGSITMVGQFEKAMNLVAPESSGVQVNSSSSASLSNSASHSSQADEQSISFVVPPTPMPPKVPPISTSDNLEQTKVPLHSISLSSTDSTTLATQLSPRSSSLPHLVAAPPRLPLLPSSMPVSTSEPVESTSVPPPSSSFSRELVPSATPQSNQEPSINILTKLPFNLLPPRPLTLPVISLVHQFSSRLVQNLARTRSHSSPVTRAQPNSSTHRLNRSLPNIPSPLLSPATSLVLRSSTSVGETTSILSTSPPSSPPPPPTPSQHSESSLFGPPPSESLDVPSSQHLTPPTSLVLHPSPVEKVTSTMNHPVTAPSPPALSSHPEFSSIIVSSSLPPLNIPPPPPLPPPSPPATSLVPRPFLYKEKATNIMNTSAPPPPPPPPSYSHSGCSLLVPPSSESAVNIPPSHSPLETTLLVSHLSIPVTATSTTNIPVLSPPPPSSHLRLPLSASSPSSAFNIPPPPPPPPINSLIYSPSTQLDKPSGTKSYAISPPPPPPIPQSSHSGLSPIVYTSAPSPPRSSHIYSKVSTKAASQSSPPPPPMPPPLTHLANSLESKELKPVPPPPAPPKVYPSSSMKSRTTARSKSPRSSRAGRSSSKRISLKPLHWVKVTRATQGSLWAETQKSDEAAKAPEIDMSELENLFSVDAKPSRQHSFREAKSEKVHMIDLTRSKNCEILLTKIKMPLPDLMSLVLTLDDTILDADQVHNLIKFCPTKEEMELLKGYSGDKEKLGKCEQLFLEIMKIPRVESKLRVLAFKIQFHSQVADLKNSLNIVNSSAEEVKNSVKLKRIMQTILSLGNALNQGTARGSAIGFRLDSLLKLSDIRARNSKITLMHYLCKVLAEKLPEVLDFDKDLVSLESAAKIELKYLAEEMQLINKGLERVEQELTLCDNDGPISDTFCKKLKEFLVVAEAEVRSLASLYSAVGKNADALALYFGEDPVRCPFEQVISTLFNFVKTFVRALGENIRQMELEKKKAQMEAERDKSKLSSPKREDLGSGITSGNP